MLARGKITKLYNKRSQIWESGVLTGSCCVRLVIEECHSIADNPDALEDLSKGDFEALMAELFARKGFDIDLYRGCKDDGIDFLKVDGDQGDPIIVCVQCKHPDKTKNGKKRRSLPVATIREIYGVAKAHHPDGCVAITSSTYTPEAKKFADLKPDEISVANAQDILAWVHQYRWNSDE